jgi:hypothetical protein
MVSTESYYYNPYDQLSYVINNYSDLCDLLHINVPHHTRHIQSTNSTVKALMAYKNKNALPKSIRYHSASTQLIESLMYRAIRHWCCISFKIVPIELELIQNNTPKTILYCVAAISIATISTNRMKETKTENSNTKKLSDKRAEGFKKDVAFYFYERACSYLKETIFPDEEEALSITAIQCYFCLSYIANLLRLPHEQKTWHYLACDVLKSRVGYINVSPALRQCWYRWYYIDAWIAISLNQECLLPDRLPFEIKEPSPTKVWMKGPSSITVAQQNQLQDYRKCCIMSNDTLYEFVRMTQYMRRFNRAIQSGTLPMLYGTLTNEVVSWWNNTKDSNLHLRLCYFSMRLVVIFSLLQHDYKITMDLLLDGLDITLEILKGLQDLKLMNCDLSTYHHMFFAIHKTLKGILFHIKRNPDFQYLETFAKQQFEMNLCILEGTDAFKDDIYQMRSIGTAIEADLYALGYIVDDVALSSKRSVVVFRAQTDGNSAKKSKKKSR